MNELIDFLKFILMVGPLFFYLYKYEIYRRINEQPNIKILIGVLCYTVIMVTLMTRVFFDFYEKKVFKYPLEKINQSYYVTDYLNNIIVKFDEKYIIIKKNNVKFQFTEDIQTEATIEKTYKCYDIPFFGNNYETNDEKLDITYILTIPKEDFKFKN